MKQLLLLLSLLLVSQVTYSKNAYLHMKTSHVREIDQEMNSVATANLVQIDEAERLTVGILQTPAAQFLLYALFGVFGILMLITIDALLRKDMMPLPLTQNSY